MVAAELQGSGAEPAIRSGFATFLELNPRLLQVAHDWQLCKVGDQHILNDHAGPEYDAEVLTRLMRIDDSAQELCSGMARHLARFGTYSQRLSDALTRVMAGGIGFT